ncbi:ATP-binding protein [bacterium]|nr:ATP-binding protein [bacterium]
MLIEFSVENYLSFKDKITFSMLASSRKPSEENKDALFDANNQRFIKSAIIFGANASGKSNFLKALHFMKSKILSAFSQEVVSNFKLDSACDALPLSFEIVFLVENKSSLSNLDYLEFRYGFSIKKEVIENEWLFGRFTAQESMLFIRKGNQFEIGSKYKEAKKVYKTLGKINQELMFLKVMADIKGEEDDITSMVIGFFQKINNITFIRDMNLWTVTQAVSENPRLKKMILNMLKVVDLGIEDFLVLDEDFLYNHARNEYVKTIRKRKKLKSIHKVYDNQVLTNNTVEFDFNEDESEGTRRFFAIIGPLIEALDKSEIVIIDELDSKMHPLLLLFIIKLFNSSFNKRCAQLIATAHNTILLDKDILRRDQIYFAEKSLSGISSIYSLSDFQHYRKDATYSKDYLLGKLGAIPYISDINSIFEEDE